MKVHELKCWPEFFSALWGDEKNFEVRRNDRFFQTNDYLHIREWDPKECKFSTRSILARVKYIAELQNVPGITSPAGFFVVMALDQPVIKCHTLGTAAQAIENFKSMGYEIA